MSVCYKTRPDVHLIVTCTRRKTVAAGDAVFPDERDVERAYRLWMERLAQARRGSPHDRRRAIYRPALEQGSCSAAARSGAEMWIYPQAWGYFMSLIPWSRMKRRSPRCRSAIALTGKADNASTFGTTVYLPEGADAGKA
jgi:hypothetical protein